MHILFIIRLQHLPHPVPDRGGAHRRPPWRVTHMFTPGSQVEQRNHISRRLALQTRRVSVTELAHSLDVGGRRR